MELVDAVIGAEAITGRKLTRTEMRLVKTVLSKRLSDEQTWDQIWGLLDVTTAGVVRLATAYREAIAGDLIREDTEYRVKAADL